MGFNNNANSQITCGTTICACITLIANCKNLSVINTCGNCNFLLNSSPDSTCALTS